MASENKIEELRNYQAELFVIAQNQNSILFLPTGSGKTCIAIWLIKHLSAVLKKPYSKGGQRTIFIVNTTELAYQQGDYITKSGNFKVRVVCAKEGVDHWGAEEWNLLEEFEIIVLTAQCYLNALTHGYMKLERVNLLIFDECHHATKGHPMREIMSKFSLLPSGNEGPRVLGLSATILNSNIKKDQIKNQLNDLELTFRSKIITSAKTEDIKKFATKPNEIIKDFVKLAIPEEIVNFLEVKRKEAERFAKCFKLKDDEIVEHLMSQKPGTDDVLLNAPGMNRTKIMISVIKDIEVHCREFGMYVGLVCCTLYIVQMYRYMFEVEKTQYVDLILYFINEAQIIRKILYNNIIRKCGNFGLRAMLNTSTQKLNYLFEVLRTLKRTDNAIIFVERKMTAKSLFNIIKLFISLEKISNINIDFITGTECNPLRNTRELLHEKKMRDKVLKSFKNNLLNVLIATNIVEEGIDIPNCGLVIMFDEVKTYRSYVQSKGRARLSTSRYIILNDVPRQKFLVRLDGFKYVEESLKQVVKNKDIWLDDGGSPVNGENDEFYVTPLKASVKEENAIPIIYRYCSTLPSDLFTSLVPFWWLSEVSENIRICKLQLPINSPLREVLVGPPRSTIKAAKQAVAFQALKRLHVLGALDDHLLPISGSAKLEDIRDWVPNWEEEPTEDKEPSAGQEVFISKPRVPIFLRDCLPVANQDCYIHYIDIETDYEVPDAPRRKFCHDLMASKYNFGILTRKPLPNICKFPAYSDLGRCRVSIQCNADCVVLDKNQMSNVTSFHKFLFLNVIRKVKKFLLFDSQSKSDYFIVPLTRTDKGISIAWKVVNQKIETKIIRPTEEERRNEIFSEKNYLGKVVAPWYRSEDDPTFYIVTNFSSGIYLHTQMDAKKTYGSHFEKAYNLVALQPGQPLMEVRPITKNFDAIKPRPVSSSDKQKKRKTNEDKPTFLPPEFVLKQSLNSVYWYKSILLPSILHRFEQLLLAEDLRQTLVKETGVGLLDRPADANENEYFLATEEPKVTVQHLSQFKKLQIKERKQGSTKSENPEDSFRDIFHRDNLYELTVEDIKKFVEYVDQPLYSSGRSVTNTSGAGDIRENGDHAINFMPPPQLITLKKHTDPQGPNHYEILQALTLLGANDTINLERLEILGDSLLKYLVSFATFIREGKMNEGLLTSLKGRIVGNKYLFYCGKKHSIPEYIQANTFTVDKGWIPPTFCIPPYLGVVIPELGKLSSLLRVTISYHEQFSGQLSPESVEEIAEVLKDFFQNVEEINKNDEAICSLYLGQQKLSYKKISDVVEALIGVYLQTSGIEAGFQVMKFFGVLDKEDYATLMSHVIPPVVPPEHTSKVLALIPDYRKLERLLNYEFRDKSLLLQAVTHPSCLTNTMTDCYQKLEFLGDAVLDFLFTSYIYQYCGKLSPGQITDLRAALVNNNTFGAVSVRLGLHKFLLDHNKSLEDVIKSFVSYQSEHNFEIHGNDMMILINEADTTIAEEVEVPKVLGDIFESLAGAIFIDSNYDLKVVWKVYFNIMAEEIAKFCSKVPINPTRAIVELNAKAKFNMNEKKNKESEQKGLEKMVVRLCLHIKKETLTFVGRGKNTALAKRAAAKLALRHLGDSCINLHRKSDSNVFLPTA